MNNWKTISSGDIVNIEKLVSEFEIFLEILTCSCVKIRIYESRQGTFIARSNIFLRVMSDEKHEIFEAAGSTSEEAYARVVNKLLKCAEERKNDETRRGDVNSKTEYIVDYRPYNEF